MKNKLVASAILAGTILVGSLFGAGTASADVYASQICSRLDVHPTKSEIVKISVQGLIDGMTSDELANQFVTAAYSSCTEYKSLISNTMDDFANGDFS